MYYKTYIKYKSMELIHKINHFQASETLETSETSETLKILGGAFEPEYDRGILLRLLPPWIAQFSTVTNKIIDIESSREMSYVSRGKWGNDQYKSALSFWNKFLSFNNNNSIIAYQL
eukprot:494978_1